MHYLLAIVGILLISVSLWDLLRQKLGDKPAILKIGKTSGEAGGPVSFLVLVVGAGLLVIGVVGMPPTPESVERVIVAKANESSAPGPDMTMQARLPIASPPTENPSGARPLNETGVRRGARTTIDPKPPVEPPAPLAPRPDAAPPPAQGASVAEVRTDIARLAVIVRRDPGDRDAALAYADLMIDVLATGDATLACDSLRNWKRYSGTPDCRMIDRGVLQRVKAHLSALVRQCGQAVLDEKALMRCAAI